MKTQRVVLDIPQSTMEAISLAQLKMGTKDMATTFSRLLDEGLSRVLLNE
jgi:hypothetical protein